jgi:hypothetical protein
MRKVRLRENEEVGLLPQRRIKPPRDLSNAVC